MIILSCNNISKFYLANEILRDLSFSINEGDKVGIVGLNGSGKTTLFNILAKETPKDSGKIYTQKNLKIGYLKQHTQVESENTIFEECLKVFTPLINMEKKLRTLEKEISIESNKGETETLQKFLEKYSTLSEEFSNQNGYGFKSEIKGTLKGLGFSEEDMEKKVNNLSGGQKSRLALAKMLLKNPDLLLLDEPTNHLDIEAISWLEKFLNDYKGSALIISHDRYFLDNVVERIFHLENLELKIYNGNYTEFMKKRKTQMEQLKKQYENQQKEIERQEEIIERFLNYGGQRYIRQAQSRQKLLDKIKRIDNPVSSSKKTKLVFEPKIKSGRDVLEVRSLAKSFNETQLFKDIDFNIYRGEKVGLIGPNGIGKTTLFKIILGNVSSTQGEITLGHHVNIGYFDQEQTNLNLNKTIIDEIWDENPELDYYQIRTYLSQFLFFGDNIFKEVGDLSGGERSRLALLKLMLSKSNFLLMDEPTNHLDIDSKEILEEALQNYNGTLFVISHDRYFLNTVTNKIFELSSKGIEEFLGNYDYYIEKKNQVEKNEEGNTKTRTQIKLEKKKIKKKKEKERNMKKKILDLEKQILLSEEKIGEIDEKLANPNIYNDIEKVKKLTLEREKNQDFVEKLYDKLINLEEKS